MNELEWRRKISDCGGASLSILYLVGRQEEVPKWVWFERTNF
jgi:hypothetical protein